MGGADTTVALSAAATARKQALAGPTGPAGLVQNAKVFGIALFACLGGYSSLPLLDFNYLLTD